MKHSWSWTYCGAGSSIYKIERVPMLFVNYVKKQLGSLNPAVSNLDRGRMHMISMYSAWRLPDLESALSMLIWSYYMIEEWSSVSHYWYNWLLDEFYLLPFMVIVRMFILGMVNSLVSLVSLCCANVRKCLYHEARTNEVDSYRTQPCHFLTDSHKFAMEEYQKVLSLIPKQRLQN